MNARLRNLASGLADWFDLRLSPALRTVAGHLRGWAGR